MADYFLQLLRANSILQRSAEGKVYLEKTPSIGVHLLIESSRENSHEQDVDESRRMHIRSVFKLNFKTMHEFTVGFATMLAALNLRTIATEEMLGSRNIRTTANDKALCGECDMLFVQTEDGKVQYVIAELKTSMEDYHNNMSGHFLKLAHIEQLHCYGLILLDMCRERNIKINAKRLRLLLIGVCVGGMEAWTVDYQPSKFLNQLGLYSSK
jgi:hypothetical protein